MDKRDILQSLIDYYSNGNKRQFAFMVDRSPSSISTWLLRNTFDTDILLAKCKHLNPAYLLTGEGEMLLTEQSSEKVTPNIIKETDHNAQVNELLSTAHALQELIEKNISILEKSQQQFDRVLNIFERVTRLMEQQTFSSYIDHAAEDNNNETKEQ